MRIQPPTVSLILLLVALLCAPAALAAVLPPHHPTDYDGAHGQMIKALPDPKPENLPHPKQVAADWDPDTGANGTFAAATAATATITTTNATGTLRADEPASADPIADPNTQLDPNARPDPNVQADHNAQADADTQADAEGEAAEIATQATRIGNIHKLRVRLRRLAQDLDTSRKQRVAAMDQFHAALQRRTQVAADAHDAQEGRRDLERSLHVHHAKVQQYARALHVLGRKHAASHAAMAQLQQQHTKVRAQTRRDTLDLRDHGLQHWVNRSLAGSVSNAMLRGAVVKGTTTLVEPVLQGMERLADANDHLTNEMSAQLGPRLPMEAQPFYAGFIAYVVLLCPLVLVISMMLKVKRHLSRMSAVHFAMLGNLYFGLLSLGCLTATMVGSVDVLSTFQQSHVSLSHVLLALHATLFSAHVCSHIVTAIGTRDQVMVTHTITLLGIGSHFTIHSFRHSLRRELLHVCGTTYFVYTFLFGYLVYQLATLRSVSQAEDKVKVDEIEAVRPSKSAKLGVELLAQMSGENRGGITSDKIELYNGYDDYRVTIDLAAQNGNSNNVRQPVYVDCDSAFEGSPFDDYEGSTDKQDSFGFQGLQDYSDGVVSRGCGIVESLPVSAPAQLQASDNLSEAAKMV